MKLGLIGLLAAVAIAIAGAGAAKTLQLTPANPQPSGLQPGLSVVYAYPADVRTLSQARQALSSGGEPGQPLTGLDYRNTKLGQDVLTARRDQYVAARITGYIQFDAAGVYEVDFLTNDGIEAKIGGQTVGKFDGRQTCDSTFQTRVSVPQAGWYPVDILWFQRLNTACLHMRMAPQGQRPDWVSDSIFAH